MPKDPYVERDTLEKMSEWMAGYGAEGLPIPHKQGSQASSSLPKPAPKKPEGLA